MMKSGGSEPVRFSAALLIILSVFYLWTALKFFEGFPFSWQWSEMLINYEGGITKRGLFGEIAFKLDPWFPAHYFVTVAVLATYLLTAYAVIFKLRMPQSLSGLLFLFAASGMMFDVHALTFGRKDFVIVAAAVAAVLVISRRLPPVQTLIAMMAIYLVAGFVIETAWWYFPFLVALFIWTRPELSPRWRIGATLAGGVYTIACLGGFYIAAQSVDVQQAAKSWQAIYPDYSAIALCCMKDQIGTLASQTIPLIWSNPFLRRGYLIGLAFALVPLVVLAFERRPTFALRPLTVAITLVALLGLLVPFVVARDWGRYIHLLTAHLFLFAWAATEPKAKFAEWPRVAQIAALAVVVVFSSTWILGGWAPPNGTDSPFDPGVLSWALGLRWG